jgi:hypothetical protein
LLAFNLLNNDPLDNSTADMYNSAPLVLSSASGTSILLSTAGGALVGFAPGASGVDAGPAWVAANDLPAIPVEDFPAATFSFLSVTAAGTVLVTTTAGGADWRDEKAFVAVANGAFPPAARSPTATSSATSSASASATSSASATATATTTTGNSDSNTPSCTLTRTVTRTRTRTPSASPSPSPPQTGLSPGEAAGVAFAVIIGAGGVGVWVFATFFGGGPAVVGALAALKGCVGVGGGGGSGSGGAKPLFRAGGGTGGERVKLLNPLQAAQRLAAPFPGP